MKIDSQTDSQTDRQADRQTAMRALPPALTKTWSVNIIKITNDDVFLFQVYVRTD